VFTAKALTEEKVTHKTIELRDTWFICSKGGVGGSLGISTGGEKKWRPVSCVRRQANSS